MPQTPALHTATAVTPGIATPASATEVGPSLYTIVEEPLVVTVHLGKLIWGISFPTQLSEAIGSCAVL